MEVIFCASEDLWNSNPCVGRASLLARDGEKRPHSVVDPLGQVPPVRRALRPPDFHSTMTPWHRSRTFRLSITLGLTVSFFIVELIVGNVTQSTSLVADSFHMLSDVLALIVAIVAIRVLRSTCPTPATLRSRAGSGLTLAALLSLGCSLGRARVIDGQEALEAQHLWLGPNGGPRRPHQLGLPHCALLFHHRRSPHAAGAARRFVARAMPTCGASVRRLNRLRRSTQPPHPSWRHIEIESPKLVLIVGAVGLGINLFSMLLFHGTARVPGNAPSSSHADTRRSRHDTTRRHRHIWRARP